MQKIPTQNHQKRQLQFFGHINRASGLEKQILSGKICGTKSRGRQYAKYIDSLNNFETRKESPNNDDFAINTYWFLSCSTWCSCRQALLMMGVCLQTTVLVGKLWLEFVNRLHFLWASFVDDGSLSTDYSSCGQALLMMGVCQQTTVFVGQLCWWWEFVNRLLFL